MKRRKQNLKILKYRQAGWSVWMHRPASLSGRPERVGALRASGRLDSGRPAQAHLTGRLDAVCGCLYIELKSRKTDKLYIHVKQIL